MTKEKLEENISPLKFRGKQFLCFSENFVMRHTEKKFKKTYIPLKADNDVDTDEKDMLL